MTPRTLLQVANVCTLTGGPGALTWTITRALPDWRHVVVFVNSGSGPVPAGMADEFGCLVHRDPAILPTAIAEHRPDVILFHNSAPQHVAAGDGHAARRIYYQHSNLIEARAARKKCDRVITVSRYLAKLAGLHEDAVLYQPVPVPPGLESRGEPRIGRICTPNAQKWIPGDVLPLYEILSDDHPSVHWEFVGCPAALQSGLRTACRGRCSFNAAGWAARERMWHWHAMLYQSQLAETYGRTVAEAQRCGCIPIVCDRGGFREQISDGIDGFLCNDSAEYSMAVAAVADPASCRRMKEQAIRSGDARSGLWQWRERFERLLNG